MPFLPLADMIIFPLLIHKQSRGKSKCLYPHSHTEYPTVSDSIRQSVHTNTGGADSQADCRVLR